MTCTNSDVAHRLTKPIAAEPQRVLFPQCLDCETGLMRSVTKIFDSSLNVVWKTFLIRALIVSGTRFGWRALSLSGSMVISGHVALDTNSSRGYTQLASRQPT